MRISAPFIVAPDTWPQAKKAPTPFCLGTGLFSCEKSLEGGPHLPLVMTMAVS